MVKTMTVGELRQWLAQSGVDDRVEVVVRVQDDDGITMVGGLFSVALDAGCTDVVVMMLDGSTEAKPLQPPYEGWWSLDHVECPGEDCGACNGEYCSICVNPTDDKPCEHDVMDRHENLR